MATMWTLSKSCAPVLVQPIRGDKVRGGGTWAGSERECHQNVGAQQESERQRSSICRRSGLPTDPRRQVGQVFSIGLHDFSLTLWRNTYSFNCPPTDITAHKYYVVGHTTAVASQDAEQMCRSVGKGWLSLWKIWLHSFVIDCCSQVLAHSFSRALEVFAEFNSFAMFISASVKMFFSGLVVHTESLLDETSLLWNQSSEAFPLRSSGAFSFATDPYRLGAVPFLSNFGLGHVPQILLSALAELIKTYPLCSQPQKHFLHPPHSKQTLSMVTCSSSKSTPIEMQIVSGQRWRETAAPAGLVPR